MAGHPTVYFTDILDTSGGHRTLPGTGELSPEGTRGRTARQRHPRVDAVVRGHGGHGGRAQADELGAAAMELLRESGGDRVDPDVSCSDDAR